jgi:UDP-N-acetylmuramyl pentapeptide synthase
MVDTPIIGRHRITNILAAAAVGVSADMSLQEIAGALADANVEIRLRILAGAGARFL